MRAALSAETPLRWRDRHSDVTANRHLHPMVVGVDRRPRGIEVGAEKFIVSPDYIDRQHLSSEIESRVASPLSAIFHHNRITSSRNGDRNNQTTELPDRKSHTRGNDSLALDR
jgi:hypothetical protein